MTSAQSRAESAPSNAAMHPLFAGDSPTKTHGPSALVNRPVWGQRKGSFVDYSAADTLPVIHGPSRTSSYSSHGPASPSEVRSSYYESEERLHPDSATAIARRSNIPRTGRVSSYDLQFDDAEESEAPKDTLFGRGRASSSGLFGSRSPTRPNIVSPDQTPMAKRSQRTRAYLNDDGVSLGSSRSSTSTSKPVSSAEHSPTREQTQPIEYPLEWLARLHRLPEDEVAEALADYRYKESTPIKKSSRGRQSQAQTQAFRLVMALSRALSDTQSAIDALEAKHIERQAEHEQSIERIQQESESREEALRTLCYAHGIKEGEIQRSLLRAPVLDAEVLKRKRLANEQESTKNPALALPDSLQEAMLEGLDDTSQVIDASIVTGDMSNREDAQSQKSKAASLKPPSSHKSLSLKSSSASIRSNASSESRTKSSSINHQLSKSTTSRSVSSAVPTAGGLGEWASGLLPWAASGASHKAEPTAAASNVKAVSPGRAAVQDQDLDDLFLSQSQSPSTKSAGTSSSAFDRDQTDDRQDKGAHLGNDLTSSSARKASKSGLGILGNLAWRRKKGTEPPLPDPKRSRAVASASSRDQAASDKLADVFTDRADAATVSAISRDADETDILAKPIAVRSSSNEVPLLLHEALASDPPGTAASQQKSADQQVPLSLLPKPPHFRAVVLATRTLNSDAASIFDDRTKLGILIARLGVALVSQAREEGKVVEDTPKRKIAVSATKTDRTRPVSMAQIQLSRTVLEEQTKRDALDKALTSSAKSAATGTPRIATATTFARSFGRNSRPSLIRESSTPLRGPSVTRLPDTYQFSQEAGLALLPGEMLGQASPRPPNAAVELESIFQADSTPPTTSRRSHKNRDGTIPYNDSRQEGQFETLRPKRVRRIGLLNISSSEEDSSGDEFEVYGGKGPVAGFATGATSTPTRVGTSAGANHQSLDRATLNSNSQLDEEVYLLTDKYGFVYNATDADIRLLRQARKASAPAPSTLAGSKVSIAAHRATERHSDDEDTESFKQDAGDSDDDVFDLTANGIRIQREKETASLKSPLLEATGGRDSSPFLTDDDYACNQGGSAHKPVRSTKQTPTLLSASHSKPALAEVSALDAISQSAASTPDNSVPRKMPQRAGAVSPSSSPTKAGAADRGLPSISNTVRMLLTQLKEMHEAQQMEQKRKWDVFLQRRQVQLQQTASGMETTNNKSVSPQKIGIARVLGSVERAPEQDWSIGLVGISRMGDSRAGKEDWRTFLSLCQTGIPICYRARIWAECSGANEIAEPGRYQELLSEHTGETNACLTQIDLDVHRTMPTNIFFGGDGQGIPKLRRLLVAFSWFDPATGYCQGMNNLAATLLLTRATEEEAFWVLVCIIEKILPSEYYSSHLLVSQADQRVLVELVEEHMPQLHQHLADLDVDLPAITFAWFLSLYTDCLPVETLFRVWDVMFVEGMVILFRVAMAILKMHEAELLATTSAASLYGLARSLTSRLFSVDRLIHLACTELKTTIRYANILEKRERHVADLTQELGLDLG